MRHIVHKHKDEPDIAHAKGIALLCKLLRMSGYYDTVDMFEKIKAR